MYDTFARDFSVQLFHQAAPGLGSARLVVAIMCLCFASLNIFFASWSLIYNAFYYVLSLAEEYFSSELLKSPYFLLFAPLLFFMFLYPLLKFLFLKLLVSLAFVCAIGR
jgi:hypothetical protein